MRIDTTTPQKGHWPTTQLDRVRIAGQGLANPEQAREAWDELFRIYWYPVYGFVRARRSQQEAADLTQEFFTRLLGGTTLQRFDPNKGRFRSYLLGAVKRFLSNARQHARRQLRDERMTYQFEALAAEERYLAEGTHQLDPELLFIRRCASCLLAEVRRELRASQMASVRAERYDRIEPFLWVQVHAGDGQYQAVAAELGVSVEVVKQDVCTLKKTFSRLLQRHLLPPGRSPAAMVDELRFMLDSLRTTASATDV